MGAKTTFPGRIVMLGYGSIGQCSLPMLLDLFDLPPERYLVMARDERLDRFAPFAARGLPFERRSLDRDNLAETLAATTRPGDLLLNLSVGVDSISLADWCQGHGVAYVDTAIEPWEDVGWDFNLPANERTEYAFHTRARRTAERWRPDGPTVVYTHGANPGIVTQFVKAALLDVAGAMNLDLPTPATREGWARLARATGTKVIHIAERDTQTSSRPKQPGEFVNTWSIAGFVEEAMMPAELGWGTHERTLPAGAHEHPAGPRNAIYFTRPGGEVFLRSWVPLGGPIAGVAIAHSETVTLSHYLTLVEHGRPVYRPTVCFVYLACDGAMSSLHETMMRGWHMQDRQRLLNEDVVDGRDELGVLLLGHGKTGWWYGSQLDIHEARRLVPGNNPTAVQVAAGVVAATVWAARNPRAGFREPEDLPHEEILATALPYLGPMVSQPTDWTPRKDRRVLFDEPWADAGDPWQFGNFLIR
ncbi:MAG: homospermidine synthase [Alphaproteobacteria bacterium]|nr:homospermidine synthase [Alphaproteobacteria bacterium]